MGVAEIIAEGGRLQKQSRWAEAVACYRRAAASELTPSLAANLATCLYELGEADEALRLMRGAADALPNNAMVRERLARVLSAVDDVAGAEAEYRAALALQPELASAEFGLGRLLLSVGRYAEGWPLMEARLRLRPEAYPPVTLGCPEWRGEPLDGKAVVILSEQGLGDQIQLARFAADLKARGARWVTLACRPEVASLLARAPGVDLALAVRPGEAAQGPRHDYWTRLFSLPERLGVTLETLSGTPYLSAPAERLERWRPPARVGLAWRASPTGENAGPKSLPPDEAQRLLATGAVSLQPEDTGAGDMADTAAIIDALDLVISIDTSVAHLAGAMGKPCWVLLPAIKPDWRWLRGRTDSPWYRSVRLYRQPRPNWAAVVDRVLADLTAR